VASTTLTLDVPESIWVGDLTRSHDDATIRVLAAVADGAGGTGLAKVTAHDLVAFLEDMEAHPDVSGIELFKHTAEEALVQFETAEPLLLSVARGSRVPLEMPFEIREGEATWELTAPREKLSRLCRQLDEAGVPYTVEEIREEIQSERLLTDRQWEVVETAVELGYYDTPRGASLTDLADELGVAKSTCSETLHRAEGTIVKRYVAETDHPTDELVH
jgi:predicted DNA binding protein